MRDVSTVTDPHTRGPCIILLSVVSLLFPTDFLLSRLHSFCPVLCFFFFPLISFCPVLRSDCSIVVPSSRNVILPVSFKMLCIEKSIMLSCIFLSLPAFVAFTYSEMSSVMWFRHSRASVSVIESLFRHGTAIRPVTIIRTVPAKRNGTKAYDSSFR